MKLTYDNLTQRGDLARDGNLETDEGLETAVTISLFSDRRAAESDDVDHGTDPRGWWGERYLGGASSEPFGSRLWQLRRAKTTVAAATRAAAWAREALQWLIDEGVAAKVEASFERSAALNGVYLLTVKITRPQKLAPRWERVWEVQLGL